MKRVFILGAGGLGREVLEWLTAMPGWNRDWVFKGFLDPNPNALDGIAIPFLILGSEKTHVIQENDMFVCAIGDSRQRKAVALSLRQKGAAFLSVCHPAAIVSSRTTIGIGTIIFPNAVIDPDAVVGDFVLINKCATIGHDTRVGDFCTISCHCDITGHASLGEGVLMGSHAAVLPHVHVEDWATVGAGSVAVSSVRAGVTAMGVPARPVFTSNKHGQPN